MTQNYLYISFANLVTACDLRSKLTIINQTMAGGGLRRLIAKGCVTHNAAASALSSPNPSLSARTLDMKRPTIDIPNLRQIIPGV